MLDAEREKLLRNPSVEGAMKFWPHHLLGAPLNDTVALAGLHKARLAWPKSSKVMVKESKAWLRANGYGATPAGSPDPHALQAANVRKPQ